MKKLNFLSIILIFCLAGCVTTKTITYKELNPLPIHTPKQVDLKLEIYTLKTPSPTVIYAHGCSGLNGAYLDWKNRLNDWGYNVVMPLSNKSRGFSSACNKRGVVNLTHNNRLEDLLVTAEWIKQQPWHKGKIGVIGFSMGGMAALNLAANGGILYPYTANVSKDIYKNKNVSVVVSYYPYCRNDHKNATIPTLILAGDADEWTPSIFCEALPTEINKNIRVVVYPDAYHGFDTPGLNYVNNLGYTIKYNALAAKDAENKTKEIFNKNLKD